MSSEPVGLDMGVKLEHGGTLEGLDETLRYVLRPGDVEAVSDIVQSSGFFTEAEARIAAELVAIGLAQGDASDYRFVLLDADAGGAIGYACYGHIDGTVSSYDLYWIAVHERGRGSGAGTRLLRRTEQLVAIAGGERVYVETSSKPLYEPTRCFYERRGYHRVAFLPDFYGPGDGKVIYVKRLPPLSAEA